jgi:hypothetical protein
MPACNGLDLACEPVSHEIYKDGGGIFYWKKEFVCNWLIKGK